MNLVIDVGNTRIKYAFFDRNELGEVGYDLNILVHKMHLIKEQKVEINLLLSGSGNVDPQIRQELLNLADFRLEANPEMKLPLELGYDTPRTLGFDRIAACVGANELYPRHNLLVIDSGTAITYNYVNERGVFLGGNISPGMEIRFRALHQYTAKLPYVESRMKYGGVGKNTPDAIVNGVMEGILFEVRGYIDDFGKKEKNAMVLITGGNSCFLKHRLPDGICFNENLGFIGLNKILEYYKI